jgi:IPT/TIG domain
MKQNTWSIVTALGVALVLTGCSAKSPTAPKPTPQPTGVAVSLTASPNPADPSEPVVIVAQVTNSGGNVPDGTAVTFDTNFGFFVDGGVAVQEVIRTTVSGRAATTLQAPVDSVTKKPQPGSAAVLARVQGTSASTQKTVAFQTVVGPTPTSGPISITSISPTKGGMQGGDRVVITGNGFVQPLAVKFIVAGRQFPATIDFVASDGASMNVVTPNVASNPPFQTDQPADVLVTAGPYSATLPGGGSTGFTYLAQATTPQIYVITPNAGPFEGGTQVVIAGVGFVYPVQVLFGTVQAQVTSSNYTEVDCIAPSITPQGPDAFKVVSVVVTNTANGKASNGVDYRYGETMYISGITPPVGPQDTATPVTIFGQGFVAPVSVTTDLATVPTWDVTSVSGTEIVARTRALPDTAYTCDNIPATIKVTNLGSNTSATSPVGAFTYQAVRPLITSVEINPGDNRVGEPGSSCTDTSGLSHAAWSSHTAVTVHGSGFQQVGGISVMTVAIGNLPDVPTTFVDSNTLTFSLPDLTQLTSPWPSGWKVACNDGSGPGYRNVPQQVGVTVRNQRSTCANSLQGAIVIYPCDTSCRVSPTITNIIPAQGTISGGTAVTISGTGFLAGATVSFGGAVVSSSGSGTSITCTTPPGAQAGAVDVTVTNPAPNSASVTRGSGFSYTATLAVTISGTGTVASNPAGINCSAGTCSFLFNQSPIGLTASTSGTFSGWSVDCTGTGTSTSVVLDAASKNCTATFTP